MGSERFVEEVEMEARKAKRSVEVLDTEERKKKTHPVFFSTPTKLKNDHHNSCNSTIARLERVDADELFVSPLTLQSFTCEFFSLW